MGRPALLIIDMVKDFVHGKLPVPGAKDIIPNINKLRKVFKDKGLPVIHVTDAHIPGVDKELVLWGDHAVKGSEGAEIVEELAPDDREYRVCKRRYSGFYATDLDLLLRELEVDTIIATGVATDICVQHTVADAFFRGYRVIVVSDATATLNKDYHQHALEYMRRVYGAKILSTERVVESLERGEL